MLDFVNTNKDKHIWKNKKILLQLHILYILQLIVLNYKSSQALLLLKLRKT